MGPRLKTPQGMFTPLDEGGTVDETTWLTTVRYELCTGVNQLDDYVAEAEATKSPVSADWETTSLNHYDDKLVEVGMSLSAKHATGLYVPLAHLTDMHLNLPREALLAVLQRLDRAAVPLVFYNYKYDGEVFLRRYQWEPTHWEDAMLAVWLEDSNQKQIGLKHTTRRLFGLKLLEYLSVTGGQSFAQLSPHDAVNYACGDADFTRRIWMLPKMQAAITEQALIYARIEKPLIGVVREGIRHGVYLDRQQLVKMREAIGNDEWEGKGKQERCIKELSGMLAATRDEIFALAGGPFELGSPKQLGEKLVTLGVPLEDRTKTGQWETGKEILAKHAPSYPICAAIVKFRELQTQDTNYLAKMVAACDHFGSHVRFPFNTMGAPTGRMSAGGEGTKGESFGKGVVNVNIQSLPDPKKQPYLPNIRSCIVANEPDSGNDDWVIVAIDYSQLQMRIAGNLSREPAWIRSFANDEDIHLTNAKLAYGRPDLTAAHENERKRGKTMGFAVLFGATDTTVAQHGGISVKAARGLIDTFFSNAHQLNAWIERTKAVALTEKRTRTALGRVRRLEEYYVHGAPRSVLAKGDREAVNTQVQGGEADIFKLACVRVQKLLVDKGWTKDWQQILWVHDELVSRVRRATLATMVPEVMRTMERIQIAHWPIALKTEAEVGWNWGELVSLDDWLSPPVVVDTPMAQLPVPDVQSSRLFDDPAVGAITYG